MWEARGVRLLVCELPVFPIIFPSSGGWRGGPVFGFRLGTPALGAVFGSVIGHETLGNNDAICRNMTELLANHHFTASYPESSTGKSPPQNPTIAICLRTMTTKTMRNLCFREKHGTRSCYGREPWV
jgi:hypothetical protein